DYVKGDAGVELPRLEVRGKVANVAQDQPVMGVPAPGFLERRFVTLDARRVRQPQLAQGHRCPAAHVQDALASLEDLAQGEFEGDPGRVLPLSQQEQHQTDTASHDLPAARAPGAGPPLRRSLRAPCPRDPGGRDPAATGGRLALLRQFDTVTKLRSKRPQPRTARLT